MCIFCVLCALFFFAVFVCLIMRTFCVHFLHFARFEKSMCIFCNFCFLVQSVCERYNIGNKQYSSKNVTYCPIHRFLESIRSLTTETICLLHVLCVSVVLIWHMRWCVAAPESTLKACARSTCMRERSVVLAYGLECYRTSEHMSKV